MKVVIDIDNELYQMCKDLLGDADPIERAIANGTLLPKGYGNIYDEKDIKKAIKNPYQCQTVLYGLELVKPIIEADTESEGQA